MIMIMITMMIVIIMKSRQAIDVTANTLIACPVYVWKKLEMCGIDF